MSQENPEIQKLQIRIDILEDRLKKLTRFCALNLFPKIHQLDKNMAFNLRQLAEAIKEPEGFDLDDYRAQINRADSKFDQMDAALADLDIPKKPSGPDQS